MAEVAVDVAHRGPVRIGLAAVDAAGQALERAAQDLVHGDIAARGRRDLQEGNLAGVLPMRFQIAFERAEPARQSLGIVEPVDPDGELAHAQAGAQPPHRGPAHGVGGLRLDRRGVDADRERADAEAVAVGHQDLALLVAHVGAAIQAHVVLQALDIAARLQADQVVGRQVAEQRFVPRQRGEQVGRGHRDVQEEADPPAETAFAQQGAERKQVVVVHPNGVAVAQPRHQGVGEPRVDPQVGIEVLATVFHQVQAEVQQRPQRAVGEAGVIAIVFGPGQVHGRVADAAVALGVHLRRRCALAAPAEPQPAAFGQRRAQRNRQSSGPLLVGQGDAVGHHHQARSGVHPASRHGRDRRIAAMISPTCE